MIAETNFPFGTQALSTFPVRHYVNHRTMRIADKARGFVFTFAGDEQASVSLAFRSDSATCYIANTILYIYEFLVAAFYAILWFNWCLY